MKRAELKREAKDVLRGRWGSIIGIMLIYVLALTGINLIGNNVPIIGTIAVLAISVPLSFGLIGQILKFSRKEATGYLDFFTIGFDNFGKSWSIYGHTLLKLLPWLIVYVFFLIGASLVCGVVLLAILGEVFAVLYGTTAAFSFSEVANIAKFILANYSFLFVIVPVGFIILSIVVYSKSLLYELCNYIGNDNPQMSGKEVVEKSKQLMYGHRFDYFVLQLSFIGWILLANLTLGIGYLWLIPYIEVTNVKFYESLLGNSEVPSTEIVQESNS